MRSMIACVAILIAAPLTACGTVGEPSSRAVAAAPNSADAAMQASRARSRADRNAAVDRSMRGY